jgi:nickel/cobalt exporter
MNTDTLFLVALQSGLFLGLIHGINPCGHSWVVLAPFVAGDSSGRRVSVLTASSITGTTLGCLAIGLALGLLSTGLPDSVRAVTDVVTAGIIVLLGLILLVRPQLLHNHDHCHCGHEHCHSDHKHDRNEHAHSPLSARRSTAWGLAILGFVNMIVPCPTVAIMYSYALESGSAFRSMAVFGIYALSTGVALAGVIYAIFKVAGIMRRLQRPWVEPAIMRTAGLLTVAFGTYTLYGDFIS